MTTLKPEFIQRIDEHTTTAKGIAFDGCHKIYILMDDAQMEQMAGYGYDPLIPSSQMTPNEMTDTVVKWFEESCGLRFVEAVSTVSGDANDGFDTVIGQGEVKESQCSSCGCELDYCCDCLCESCLSDEYGCCCDCSQSFYYVSQSSEDNSYCSDCYVEEDEDDEDDD